MLAEDEHSKFCRQSLSTPNECHRTGGCRYSHGQDHVRTQKESENCKVETLLEMCFEARDLVIRCTPFLKTQRTYPGHVYMLICYHLGIQLYSDVEYRYLSYIDPKYIETRVRWSMAFQAIYGNH